MSDVPQLDPPPGEAAETITVSCPHCDWTYTGPAKGRNSAPWRKGTHLRNKHGEAGKGKARRPAAAPSDEAMAERPVLGVVRDMAAHVGGKGAPSADALATALGRGMSIVTTWGAATVVESDPTIPEGEAGDAWRDRLIDDLSLSPKTAQDVMRPIGRMLAPTRLNKRYGRGVVENVDVLGAIAELAAIGNNWRRYLRMRAAALAAGVPAALPAGPGPVAAAGTVVAANGQITTPPPQMGRLVTAEDVQRMRGQG